MLRVSVYDGGGSGVVIIYDGLGSLPNGVKLRTPARLSFGADGSVGR